MNPQVPRHLAVTKEIFEKASLRPADRARLGDFLKFITEKHALSDAQIFQDLFAVYILNEKRNGYFIDFGATDGLSLNNTYLLEKTYGWEGIVAEPARCWHEQLKKNRACTVDFRCVWTETGKTLEFNETVTPEYSTIDMYSNDELPDRDSGAIYKVETVSLNDLAAGPAEIDYLSIDTEGSELAILKGFDFSRRRIKVITVEHNFTEPARQNMAGLLASLGYARVFETFSHWDDWYVHYTALAQSPLAGLSPAP